MVKIVHGKDGHLWLSRVGGGLDVRLKMGKELVCLMEGEENHVEFAGKQLDEAIELLTAAKKILAMPALYETTDTVL